MIPRYTLLLPALLWFRPALGQQTTLDWKLHNVGQVRQVVTNVGGLSAKGDNAFDFRGLINTVEGKNNGKVQVGKFVVIQ